MADTVQEIKEARGRANELLGQLGTVRRQRSQQEARLNAKTKALKDRHGPEIDRLKEHEERLIEELTRLVKPRLVFLFKRGTQTIFLRNGQIQLRHGRPTLQIDGDEATIIRRIARRRGLTRFTRIGKRTLDKEALKKDPAFVAKIKGLRIVKQGSLVIKPGRVQGQEIILDDDTLSVPIDKED